MAVDLAALSEGFCPTCKGPLGLHETSPNFCFACILYWRKDGTRTDPVSGDVTYPNGIRMVGVMRAEPLP